MCHIYSHLIDPMATNKLKVPRILCLLVTATVAVLGFYFSFNLHFFIASFRLYLKNMMMTRNLTLNRLCNKAFRLPIQVSSSLPTSTILCSKGANSTSILTPFTSISHTKRFYCVHPTSPPTPTEEDTPKRGGIIGAVQWFFATSFETVPYTNRTRRILYPRDTEKRLGEADFNEFKKRYQENEEWLLSPTHPHTVKMKRILDNIIGGLHQEMKKLGHASSSYNSITERVMMRVLRKTPPATTSHLEGLDWGVFVVDDPVFSGIPWCHCFYSEGKIVVNQCLINRLNDIQIAAMFGHQVARIVGRRKGEKMTNEMGITYLNNLLGETFTKYIGQRIVSHIQKLPFNTRLNEEAEYIGLQILAAAGYDPEKVIECYTEMGVIIM